MQTPSLMHLSVLASYGFLTPVAKCTQCFLVSCKCHIMYPATIHTTLNIAILLEVRLLGAGVPYITTRAEAASNCRLSYWGPLWPTPSRSKLRVPHICTILVRSR